jgi:hypothetical protein
MKRHITSIALAFLFVSAFSMGAAVTLAAETSETTALTTQTKQMDSLASTRGEANVSGRISSDFGAFAGSTANSDALVSGLRNGTAITLMTTDAKGVTTATTFTPPTGKMGYGNVYISLALAKQQLAAVGITQPTAQQLQAALNGGTVTTSTGQTVTLTGVLQMRAQGMGWGQIAQSLGTKLGPVISGMKSANAQVTSLAATGKGKAGAAVTTGAGASAGSKSGMVSGAGKGADTAGGNAYGRGIVTGAGTPAASGAGTGQASAYGRGIATGAGAAGQAGSAASGKAVGKGN